MLVEGAIRPTANRSEVRLLLLAGLLCFLPIEKLNTDSPSYIGFTRTLTQLSEQGLA